MQRRDADLQSRNHDLVDFQLVLMKPNKSVPIVLKGHSEGRRSQSRFGRKVSGINRLAWTGKAIFEGKGETSFSLVSGFASFTVNKYID